MLRERTRTRELGVSAYAWASDSAAPVLMIPGPVCVSRLMARRYAELAGSEGAITPTLSPDGTQLSFVRGGELFLMPIDESSEARQLTLGAEDGLTHGLADYIAQEEFGLLRGHWWSQDGRIAYLEADERHIAPYPIVHQGGDGVDVETHRYPFSGDENPRVSLRLIDVDSGEDQELALPDEDGYLVRVAWWPSADGGQRLVAQWVDREQKRLRLLAFDDGTRVTLIDEVQEPWINVADDAQGLKDGTFLWSSEQSGFPPSLRACCRRRTDPSLTEGDWPDRRRHRRGWETGAGSTSVARVDRRLSGELSGCRSREERSKRSPSPAACMGASLSKDGKWLAMVSSSLGSPPSIALVAADGSERRTLYQSEASALGLGLAPPELRTFTADDGTHPVRGAVPT